MQCVYDASQSLEEYLSQAGWKRAPRPERCPFPGCGKARCLTSHGFYGRFFGRLWARIRRWLCRTTGRTVSMLPSWLGSHVGESLETIETATSALRGGSTRREAARAAGLIEEDASRRRVQRWRQQVDDVLGKLRGALGLTVRRGEGVAQAFCRDLGLPADAGGLFARLRARALVRLPCVVFGPLDLYRGVGMRDGGESTPPQSLATDPSPRAVAHRKRGRRNSGRGGDGDEEEG